MAGGRRAKFAVGPVDESMTRFGFVSCAVGDDRTAGGVADQPDLCDAEMGDHPACCLASNGTTC